MIYHVPTKYKIFLSKGVLSPCNLRQGASSLDPCEHLTHTECPSHNSKLNDAPMMHKQYRGEGGAESGGLLRPLLPFFDDSQGKWATRGNLHLVTVEAWNPGMESLVEINGTNLSILLQSYMNFTLGGNKFSWTFKVLKPTSFRGLCTLDPHQGRSPDPTRGPKELLKLLNKSR